MSEETNSFIDKKNYLRLLYSIRENMQKYSKGEKKVNGQSVADNIVSIYLALLRNEKTNEEMPVIEKAMVNQICQSISNIEYDFNPGIYRTTSRAEDVTRDKKDKEIKANAKLVDKVNSAIKAEIQNSANAKAKGFSVDDEPVSISVIKDGIKGVEKFEIKFSNKEETLKISVGTKGKNKGSQYSLIGNKISLDNEIYTYLQKNGELSLSDQKEESEAGKHYSPTEYKKASGITDQALLDSEREVFNSLSRSDQKQFLLGLKQRKVFLAKRNKAITEAGSYIEKFKQLGKIESLNDLKGYNQLLEELLAIPARVAKDAGKDYSYSDEFISRHVCSDEYLWDKFIRNDSRKLHSDYEAGLRHIIDSSSTTAVKKMTCKQIFDQILSSADENIEHEIYQGFKDIQTLTYPLLPKKLTAEIFTYGIFLNAFKRPVSETKIKNMNKVLNEFGLNIKFEQIEITKIPEDKVTDAAMLKGSDRKEFEDTKKYDKHQEREADFIKHAMAMGIKKAKRKSVHHYIALKYNAFVEKLKIGKIEIPKLNDESNYIFTASQDIWNTDAHDLIHRFDTDGDFLLKYEDGTYTMGDFNETRKKYNNRDGQKLYIMAPVLQVKEGTKYRNVLSLADGDKNNGFYISNDQNQDLITIPPYCNGERKPQTRMASNARNKEAAR